MNVVRNSYLMVDLFFVLSGFVIFHSYHSKLRTRRDAVKFMFLRLGRIYPLHLVFLFVFLGIEAVKYVGESRFGFVPYQSHAFTMNNGPTFAANLLLVHPFFPFANKTFNSPSWSIGVEFYVYLLFAVVAVLARKKAWLLITCGLLMCVAAAVLGLSAEPGLTADVGFSFLRCVLGFFAGVFAYQIYDRYQGRILVWSAKVEIVLLFVLGIFLSLKENPRWDYAVIPLFVLLVIVVATSGGGGGGFERVEFAALEVVGQGFIFHLYGTFDHHAFPDARRGVGSKKMASG